jgi:hypothetical protein
MGILTEDMKRVVREQKLVFIATVCPDGTANLSPKGTTTVWDDDHLVFADIRSPQSVQNIEHNPSVEINVVDPLVRKGYQFKGQGIVLRSGDVFPRVPDVPRNGAHARYPGRGADSSGARAGVLSRLRSRRHRRAGERAMLGLLAEAVGRSGRMMAKGFVAGIYPSY